MPDYQRPKIKIQLLKLKIKRCLGVPDLFSFVAQNYCIVLTAIR